MSFVLRSSIVLDGSLSNVFEFFADAANLETITPPELRFRILTPLPMEMRAGARIDYSLRLYGVPFSWQTEIPVWEPAKRFIDQQISGPFRLWIHEHRFTPLGPKRTRIEDEVHYALPLEPLGRLAHPLVRRKLERIFSYREQRVAEIVGSRSELPSSGERILEMHPEPGP